MVALRTLFAVALVLAVSPLIAKEADKKTNTKTKQQEREAADEKALREKFIASMPKDATIPELDTADFDKASPDFKWPDTITERIAKLKQRIVEKREGMLKDQAELRKKCEAAPYADLDYLGRRYLEVRTQCVAYKPIKDFFNGLSNIITAADREKLKEKGIPQTNAMTR
jgi:hypothetical protein